MTKEVVMGIVGFGGMGSYHVHELIFREKNVRLKGGYDIKPERNEALGKEGYHVYASYEEMLNDPEIELVLVATPNDTHKALATAALEHGKNVISEKPAMMSSKELEEVLAVAKKAGKQFFVHQNRRWDPDFRIITELYEKKPLGEVFDIESRVHGANGIPGDWRHNLNQGGGMVLDWGVHLLDQLLFLIDSPVTSVQADLSYIEGNEVDDGFEAKLYFKNGVIALVEVGTSNFIKLPRWYVKALEGTAVIDDWDLSGKMVKATGFLGEAPTPIQAGVGLTKTMAPPSEEATETLPLPEGIALAPSVYENIFQVLRNDAPRIVKNEEVLRVMRLMETIFKAGHAHQVLPFEK